MAHPSLRLQLWNRDRNHVTVVVVERDIAVEHCHTPVDNPETDSKAVFEGGFVAGPNGFEFAVRYPLVGISEFELSDCSVGLSRRHMDVDYCGKPASYAIPRRRNSHTTTPLRGGMYTGRTDTPCCLCGNPKTTSRIEVPPRAVQLMKNSGPIAWQDIVSPVTLQFCADDWELVRDLAVEMGHHPLSRCNVAYASFDLREDFEAMLNTTKAVPDQTKLETRLLERSHEVLDSVDDPLTEERQLVEATIIDTALDELGLAADTHQS